MKRILYLLFAVMFMACSDKEDVPTYKDAIGTYTGMYEVWINAELIETGNFSFEITGNKNELLFEWNEKDISFPVKFWTNASGSWELDAEPDNGFTFFYRSTGYTARMSDFRNEGGIHDYSFTLDQ